MKPLAVAASLAAAVAMLLVLVLLSPDHTTPLPPHPAASQGDSSSPPGHATSSPASPTAAPQASDLPDNEQATSSAESLVSHLRNSTSQPSTAGDNPATTDSRNSSEQQGSIESPYSSTADHSRAVTYPLVSLPEIARRDSVLSNGDLARVRLLRDATDRHPNIRVEEQVALTEDGEEILVGYDAMVADHVLLATDSIDRPISDADIESMGLTIRKKLAHSPLWLIETPVVSVNAVPETVALLQQAFGEGTVVEPDFLAFPTFTPNDPRLDDMWAIPVIKAEQAWDITIGDPDVVVAVMDTGFRVTHEDFQGTLWENPNEIPGNGVDDDSNGFIDDIYGWNVEDDNGTIGNGRHGTHVAGTMAAAGNNGKGVAGMGFGHKVMVFDVGSTLGTSESVEALDYVTYMKRTFGVHVVSMNISFGSLRTNSTYTGSSSRRASIQRARDAGILTVMAAGNDGKKLEGTSDIDSDGTFYNHFPSSNSVEDFPNQGDWDSVIAVAASTSSDRRAGFSNYGVDIGAGIMVVDIAAPGEGILSLADSSDSGYRNSNGTSMASPHVAGVVGVIASANRSLGARNIKDILMSAGSDMAARSNYWNSRVQSGGRLDLYEAVLEAQRYPVVTIANLPDDAFLPSGATLALEAFASDSDGSVTSVSFYDQASGDLIGSDSNGADGWSVSWSPADGTYNLLATATDNDGNTTRPDLATTHVAVGGLVIDNTEGASEQEGSRWIFSSSSVLSYNQESYGGSVHYRGIGTASTKFYFNFVAPLTGTYAIDFHRTDYGSHPSSLPATLTHDGGTANLTMDVKAMAIGFNEAGSGYQLTRGQTYTFVVDAETATGGSTAVVDAIRLRPTSLSGSEVFVSITAADPIALDDGSDTGHFVVTRSTSAGALTVNLSTAGSATAGSDYSAIPASITFADGESSKQVLVSPLADLAIEPDETVEMSVLENAAYLVSGKDAVITIKDVNDAGSIEFTSTSATANEGDGTLTLTLRRTRAADGEVSVDVVSSGGSATAPGDYAAINQTVTWANQDSTDKTVELVLVDDNDVEPTETVIITLSNPSGGVDVNSSAHTFTATVNDNEVNPPGTVTLTSPSNGTDFVRGSTLILTAEATDPQGVKQVEFWKDGSKLGEDSSAPYTYTWSQAWDDSSQLTARLIDNADAAQDSPSVNITSSIGPPVGEWTAEDIGNVSATGNSSYDSTNSAYYLRGSGANIKDGSDEFHFLHQPFSGNGEIVARITAYDYSNNRAKVGIMIRESTAADAPFAMVNIRNRDGGDIEFARRASAGSNSTRSDDGHNYSPLPIWARVTRDGNTFTAYYSENGSDWTEIGSQTINMNPIAIAGLCVTARNDGNYARGSFDNVLVSSGGNVPPVVTIDSPSVAPLQLPQTGVELDLESTVNDADPVTITWTQEQGPAGGATFSSTSAEDTTVSFSEEGSYLLQIAANDGTFTTTETISVTVGEPASAPGNMILHYELDEGAGSGTASDSSGNARDGTVASGVTFTPSQGVQGGSASFDGSSTAQILDSDGENYINGLSAITVSTWVKSNATNSNSGWMIGIEPDGGGGPMQFRYDSAGFMNTSMSNGMQFQLRVTNDGGSTFDGVIYETASNQQTTEWQHVVLVWESGSVPRVYIDGIQDTPSWVGAADTENLAATGVLTGNDRLLIGRSIKDTSAGWNGKIDDVRIYDRALSTEEVEELYAATGQLANIAPNVSAGSDGNASSGVPVNLNGSVSDSDQGPGSLSSVWSQVSGPGVASFDDTSAPTTDVTFSDDGNYTLQLTATDGSVSVQDQVTFTVTTSALMDDAYDQDWRDFVFASHPLGTSGSHTDFNAKGNGVLANGLIYALQINSLDHLDSVGKLPTTSIADLSGNKHLQISFRRIEGGTGDIISSDGYTAGGVTYFIERSDSVGNWSSGSSVLEQVGPATPNQDGTESMTVRAKDAIDTSSTTEFLRLRVILAR